MKRVLLTILSIIICSVQLCGCSPSFVSNSLASSPTERVVQLGKLLCENYVYDKNGSVYVAQTVSRTFKRKGNVASVWHVTAVIAATNYLVALCDGSDKAYFSDINEKLWDSLSFYAGSAEIATYRGKSVQRMYAVNRAKYSEKADIGGKTPYTTIRSGLYARLPTLSEYGGE